MSDHLALADDFEPASEERWLRAVRGVLLKNEPDATDEQFAQAFARQLVHRAEDGFDVQPLYSADSGAPQPGRAGFAPFVRSTHAAPAPWEVRQRVWPGVEGSTAVAELESGATGVLLELPRDADTPALERALQGVHLDLAPVSLSTPPDDDGIGPATSLADVWQQRQVPADARRGSLGVDPIGSWARSGGTSDLDAGLAATAELLRRLSIEAPGARAVVVDGTIWHEAGATAAQELAWSTAVAATYVRRLVAAGTDLRTAAASLEFRWAADADQFTTIAKLRAARRLWARVAELSGLPPAERGAAQHVDGSRVMMARYDPWVNALRSTVACFAAALGGADAITITPHDGLRARGGSALGRRIARNTQTILQMESNLSRVLDPVGGSWYVETLTDELAQAAWSRLREVESAGGILDALRDHVVERALVDARRVRAEHVATRRRPLTGVSEFPDIDEEPPPASRPTDGAPATPFPPLGLHRLADGFEAQRGRADRHAERTGERPAVYLATIGNAAAYTPRLTYAKNFFEAGGIRTISGEPEGIADAPTSVACLCSSDRLYRDGGDDAAARLTAAGATRVYVAGRKVRPAGVDEDIGQGVDVLDVLTRTLDDLGVAR